MPLDFELLTFVTFTFSLQLLACLEPSPASNFRTESSPTQSHQLGNPSNYDCYELAELNVQACIPTECEGENGFDTSKYYACESACLGEYHMELASCYEADGFQEQANFNTCLQVSWEDSYDCYNENSLAGCHQLSDCPQESQMCEIYRVIYTGTQCYE